MTSQLQKLLDRLHIAGGDLHQSKVAKLRVCHLGKYYPPARGGIETYVQTLARSQAALGADVRVVCVNDKDRKGRDVTPSRYGATPCADDCDGQVRISRIGRSATVARLDVCPRLPWIMKEINRNPVDILHVHTPNPTMLLMVANFIRPGTRIVITHHSDIVRQRLLKYLQAPFEELVYARSSLILASSENYISHSPMLTKHRDKVEVLPLGIDLKPFTHPSPAALAQAKKLKAEHGDIIWLAVGRCVYYKGFHQAIQALKHVPGKLVIIGQGPLETKLKELAKHHGVEDRVLWRGNATQDELIGAYHAATALWFPSTARSEAFGLVQVEAMAAGLPVINTEIPGSGVSWVSLGERTGITIPMHDHRKLAEAANRLLSDADLRRRFSLNGKLRALTIFDHRQIAHRSLELYEQVLNARSVPRRELTAESDAAFAELDSTHPAFAEMTA